MENRENEVPGINHGRLPRENKVMRIIRVLQYPVVDKTEVMII